MSYNGIIWESDDELTLRDNRELRENCKIKLRAILDELDDVDENRAIEYCNWLHEKTQIFKKHCNNDSFPKLPENMEQGDIIKVRFGINLGSELSDTGENSKGHFAMFWCQQGQQVIVIPLTKTPQPKSNKLGIPLGVIDGLPKREKDGKLIDVVTYAKIDAVRSVHLRRISRISGVTKGKIKFSDHEKLKEINDIISNQLLFQIPSESTLTV